LLLQEEAAGQLALEKEHILVKDLPYTLFAYNRRQTLPVQYIGGNAHPIVMLDIAAQNLKDPYFLTAAGYKYDALLDKYNMADQACDLVYLADELPSFSFPGNLKQIYNYHTWLGLKDKTNCHPLINLADNTNELVKDPSLNIFSVETAAFNSETAALQIEQIKLLPSNAVLLLKTEAINSMASQRAFFISLLGAEIKIPVIIKSSYPELNADDLMLFAATDLGALLTDGFGDGVWIDAPMVKLPLINSTSFGILQATRTRISKAEYISCPSCGRTLFDLQETTQLIRSRTDHLKGIKIGIMGCIVNGPGEMADADYGYVGTGPGKITLYRGKEVYKKNVNSSNALDDLIKLIKDDGKWIEVK